MQAIRNKLHGKSKRRSFNTDSKKVEERTETTTTTSAPLHNHYEAPLTETVTTTTTTTIVEDLCPTPPPMPPSDFWKSGDKMYSWPSDSFLEREVLSYPVEPTLLPIGTSLKNIEFLPTEIIEKPLVIHENIRREQVEEIQPVIHVEREKTEIRQITQPLVDKEVMPVVLEQRTLPIEVLPTLNRDSGIIPERFEESTRTFEETKRQVVEKAPIIEETEKWRIVEEVTPIIYKETIIPHIIRTSRPIREVIVEAPIFSERILPTRELTDIERERYSRFFKSESYVVNREVPVVIRENLAHKEVLKEVVEETTSTTTTTSVAPTVGVTGSGAHLADSSRTLNSTFGPTIVKELHKNSTGPHGEKIHTDSITTTFSSDSLIPTKAI